MKAQVHRRKDVWRVVYSRMGKLVRNEDKSAIDGGGFAAFADAQRCAWVHNREGNCECGAVRDGFWGCRRCDFLDGVVPIKDSTWQAMKRPYDVLWHIRGMTGGDGLFSCGELSESMGKDETIIQRSLHTLLGVGRVARRRLMVKDQRAWIWWLTDTACTNP